MWSINGWTAAFRPHSAAAAPPAAGPSAAAAVQVAAAAAAANRRPRRWGCMRIDVSLKSVTLESDVPERPCRPMKAAVRFHSVGVLFQPRFRSIDVRKRDGAPTVGRFPVHRLRGRWASRSLERRP